LEFLVLLEEEFVQRFCKHVVYLSRQLNLGHLQLNQVVLDHCVLEVSLHQLLQKNHVFGRELAQTFVQRPSDLRVSLDLAIRDVIDVVFAVIQIIDQSFEVLEHQLPVRQNLLVFDQITD
jgi:hypothetical protein